MHDNINNTVILKPIKYSYRQIHLHLCHNRDMEKNSIDKNKSYLGLISKQRMENN